MQLRRSGLLLPLTQAILALAVGCSPQSGKPAGESAFVPVQPGLERIVAAAAKPTPDALQHFDSIPILQQAPLTPTTDESATEIVQTRYGPLAADPSETFVSNPTVPVEFGRAPDYTWLQGELLFSSVRGVWRLRYAAADDDDPYGGSVTLVDLDTNLGLQAGQRVRVKGKLINPRTSEPSPYYHVLQVEKR